MRSRCCRAIPRCGKRLSTRLPLRSPTRCLNAGWFRNLLPDPQPRRTIMQSMSCRKALLSLAMMFLIAGTAFTQRAAPQAKKKTAASSKPTPAAPALQLEPKALEILKATSDRLAGARTVSFIAVELFEQLTRQDVPLGYTAKYEVTLQRPDKLRVLKPADGATSDFYYDGKSMMAYAPVENLLAVADAPATIDATMEKA